MAQQDQACDESNGQWLPLTEYAVRSGISTSTIRRKIKSNAIKYRLENGRYLLLYVSSSSHAAKVEPSATVLPTPETKVIPKPVTKTAKSEVDRGAVLPIIDRSVSAVTEAYERAFKEKDERIHLLERQNAELKERLQELRTLVKALEEKYEVRY